MTFSGLLKRMIVSHKKDRETMQATLNMWIWFTNELIKEKEERLKQVDADIEFLKDNRDRIIQEFLEGKD